MFDVWNISCALENWHILDWFLEISKNVGELLSREGKMWELYKIKRYL